eukprot:gene4974-6195_t
MTLSIAKPFVTLFKKSKSSNKKKSSKESSSTDDYGSHQSSRAQTGGSTSSSTSNKQQSIDDKIEEKYIVQYQVESSSRGASHDYGYEEREILINEQGVFLYNNSDPSGSFQHFSFLVIQEFSLDQNWYDWVIILRDGSKHYFKSYEALQIHLKMDEIIRKLISRIPSQSQLK